MAMGSCSYHFRLSELCHEPLVQFTDPFSPKFKQYILPTFKEKFKSELVRIGIWNWSLLEVKGSRQTNMPPCLPYSADTPPPPLKKKQTNKNKTKQNLTWPERINKLTSELEKLVGRYVVAKGGR